ncbi:MerR family DNA-binding transcriptional regulator [Paenibacillus anaericanus]|uniref:MerR family DNA-binding transcriptional regulator n=1 Tax=Paenibacillus anaericanus TaxID=170367 RepID=A0A3S1DG23_9BACL|nr:MerR family DNA-binding transcriptional regulator [Paenibacillus anaericanus]RUT40327.1 MerR family DNA-binding transcriptional regulator [Paenibacillus anaericanus]
MKKSLFSIGYMSKFTGVHIKSLRYYEEIGVLIPEYVDPETNYRYYSYQQIPTVMALRFCLELGIPLINFKKYHDTVSGYLHYDDLLKDGQVLLDKKVDELNKIISYIYTSVQEIQESEKQTRGVIFQRSLERMDVLLRLEQSNKQNHFNNIGLMIDEAKSQGLETGFVPGSFNIFDENKFRNYTFIDINANKHNVDIMFFPKGTYLCIQDKGISVNDAPTIFPDIYKSYAKVLAIATEVFTSKYDLNSPLIELRVIGIKDETYWEQTFGNSNFKL